MSETITNNQIFNSLDAGYRVINGIRINLGCGIEALQYKLDEMVEEHELQRLQCGDVWAYFRPDEHPARFYLTGGGKVRVEWAGDSEDEEPKKEKVMETTPVSNGNGKASWSRKAIEITEGALEEFAATLPSDIAIAKEFGFKTNAANLMKRVRKDPVLFDAYKRGLNRNTSRRNGEPAKRGPYKVQKPNPITAKPQSLKDRTAQLQKTNGELQQIIKDATSEEKPIELENVDVRETVKPVSHRHVNLTRGGQLLVGFEGSVFDLTSADWQLIDQISTLMGKFEAAKRS